MVRARNMTLAALLEDYRQQGLQPDWKVQQGTMNEDLSALTWTLHDEADQPWFGVLLITPAEEGVAAFMRQQPPLAEKQDAIKRYGDEIISKFD